METKLAVCLLSWKVDQCKQKEERRERVEGEGGRDRRGREKTEGERERGGGVKVLEGVTQRITFSNEERTMLIMSDCVCEQCNACS